MNRLRTAGVCVVIVFCTAAPSWLDNLNKKMDKLGSRLENSDFVQNTDEKLSGWSSRFDDRIGRLLGREDQASLEAAVEETVEREDDRPHREQWRNADSTANATITTTAATKRRRDTEQSVVASVVVSDARLEPVQERIVVTKKASVRAGPGAHYAIIQTLPAKTRTTAMGRTDNGWYLLEQDQLVYGYIRADLVVKAQPRSILSIDDDSQSTIDLESADTTRQKLPARRICRDVTVELSTDDAANAHREEFEVCKAQDGRWDV